MADGTVLPIHNIPQEQKHSRFKVDVHCIVVSSSKRGKGRAGSRCHVNLKTGARAEHVEEVEDKEADVDTKDEEDDDHNRVELANVEETDEPKRVPGRRLALRSI